MSGTRAQILLTLQDAALGEAPGVRHTFFTRVGGVSEGIYEGLNCGRGSKDAPGAAERNRAIAMEAMDAEAGALVTPYQIHSPDVLTVDAPWPGEPPRGDALVTDRPGLVLGIVTADCAPVLLADAEARVIGAAHAGWRGALGGVIENTVAAMAELGAEPGRIVAAVGPCIAQASYEVGREFYDTFVDADAGYDRFFAPGAGDKAHFDLSGFCLARLRAAGVGRAEALNRDTYAEEDMFYSNRRAVHRGEGDYGRLLSAITIAPGASA